MINKIKIIALSLSLYYSAGVYAQNAPVKISYKVNADKSVDFSYKKTDPGNYTVVLILNNLTNSSASQQQELNVNNYAGSLLTLTPSNKNQGIAFSYTNTYIRGKLKPKYNADFLYTLPYKKGVKTKVADVGFVGARYFGNTTPDDWKVYRFYTKNEDTVTAVRKGVVVDIKDLYETNAPSDVAYSSQVNELVIEHGDGTLANYRGFKKGSFAVKIGQTVFPGTALGINTKSNTTSDPGITLFISYLKSANFENSQNENLQNSKSYYGFITPHFFTTENPDLILTAQQEYIATVTPEIIQKEFTKKELKQQIK